MSILSRIRALFAPLLLAGLLGAGLAAPAAAAEPVVGNLSFAQRTDGSGIMDIDFDLSDADGDPLTVRLQASGDGGQSWLLPCVTLTGDLGTGIPALPGRHIEWQLGADLPDQELGALVLRLLVSDGPPARDMLRIPAGSFTMGSAGDRQVTLSRDFHLDRCELSNQEYLERLQWALDGGLVVMETGKLRLGPEGILLMDFDDPACEFYFDKFDRIFSLQQAPLAISAYPGGYDPTFHPVKAITWHGAALFCNWLSVAEGLPPAYDEVDWSCNGGDPFGAAGYRLPTEAEWEYTARLSSGDYPWGDSAPDCQLCNARPGGQLCWGWTIAVGSLPGGGSLLGLQDLSGNVEEWCHDRHEALAPGDWEDPPGAAAGESRVVKGGSFYSSDGELRADFRLAASPGHWTRERGFRVALSCGNSYPHSPTLLSPEDGVIFFEDEILLSWSGSDPDGDGLLYDLHLDGELFAAGLVDTTFLLSGLLPDESVHEWRVLARDSEEFTQWSPSRRLERWLRPQGEGLRFDFDMAYFESETGELIADHCLILHEGSYHCFHIYQHASGGPEQLGHLTSDDLRNWTRQPDILPVSEGEAWEGWGIWAPQVMINPDPSGALWMMLYTGVEGDGRPQRIGLAFSDDLQTWWRADAAHEALNPFYHPDADWSAWDDSAEAPDWSAPCRDPFVLEADGAWHLLATGKDAQEHGVILHAVSPPDSFLFQGRDEAAPLLLREDLHYPESVQLQAVVHLDGQTRWHLFYSGLDGTRHQSAPDLQGGAGGWDGGAYAGDQVGGFGYTAAELTYLNEEWIFSQHIAAQSLDRYVLRFALLDFDVDPDGAPVAADVTGVEAIRGRNESGAMDASLSWTLEGTLLDHAFEHQPTWGDNPLHDPGRGVSSGLIGNAYLATFERRPRPDWGGPSGPGDHYDDYGRSGWIRSSSFELRRNRLQLLVGGGDDSQREFVALVRAADERLLFMATGENSHVLSERVWDCESLRGEEVFLVVADLSGDDWGCIAVDAIVAVEDLDGQLPGDAPLVDGPLLSDLIFAP
jgi:formylglycine-generating enzyme required for sulfatase activity